jgi:hypothetical protein
MTSRPCTLSAILEMTAQPEPTALLEDALVQQIMPIEHLNLTLPDKKSKTATGKRPLAPTYRDSPPMKTASAPSAQPAPLHNPLTRRLQYLTEIPPSPPVDLAPLKLLDTDGDPIVHPLQLDPEPATPWQDGVDEVHPSPPSLLSEKGLALGLDGIAPVPALVAPAPRPPQAFIKRHASNTGSGTAPSSQGSSSTCSTPSPLAYSPIMLPAIPPSPVSMAVKSPLAAMNPEQRGKLHC